MENQNSSLLSSLDALMISIVTWASQLKRETSCKQNQAKLAITKLLHFMKISGYLSDFWPAQDLSIHPLFS